MKKIDIILGDWSDDGHGKSDKVTILVNKSQQEMQQAYIASCKTLGISFNHNDDYTGLDKEINPEVLGDKWKEAYDEQRKSRDQRQICCEYEDSSISEYAWNILKTNCSKFMDPETIKSVEDSDEDRYISHDSFIDLLMAFVSYSLPEFKWEYPEKGDEIPVFNGYWDSGLNVQMAYGLYY